MTNSDIINQIKGLICERSWRGFGTAIFFDFKKDKKLFTICLDFCSWEMYSNNGIIAKDTNEYSIIDTGLENFNQKKIEGIEIDKRNDQTLIIFSDNLKILTHHKDNDQQWYLLTPTKVMSVGKNCSIKVEERKS